MRVEWYGQSAFHLSTPERSVAIDPFADMSAMAASRGMQAEAIGAVDLLILPVGGGPTIGAEGAAAIVARLAVGRDRQPGRVGTPIGKDPRPAVSLGPTTPIDGGSDS